MSATSSAHTPVLSATKEKLLKLLLERQTSPGPQLAPYARSTDGGVVRLPTSWAQQRLWFIDQLAGGGGAAYHIPMPIRLRGALDMSALRRALDILVQRHEVLRTVFVSVEGEPYQEVMREARFALALFDLRGIAPAEQAQCEQAHRLAEARERFDLRTGPLIRGRLLMLEPQHHVLLVTMHHIISDGWSMGVFASELAELYRAFRDGHRDPLQPLVIQYADYAQWQREWLHAEVMQRQLRYWRAQLQDAAQALELPTDRPRPAEPRYRGEVVAVQLDAPLSAQLGAFVRRQGMTRFMVLYAVWAMLLSRLSGQPDILVGTPIANRRRRELEGLIGFFVNTLVLRVEITPQLSVASLLKRVKEVTLSAYDHQDVPFEMLVDVLRPERHLNRHPVFQSLFVLQNTPRCDCSLPGLAVTIEDGVTETSKLDVLMSLEERDDAIVGCINYDSDLFERSTIERWAAQFELLLRGVLAETHGMVGDLPLLSEPERARIKSFNATRVSYPTGRTIHALFEDQVLRTPQASAVLHGEQSLSYVQLNAQANQLARHLRDQGIGPGERVGLCVERSIEMVIGLLGVLKAGAAYVPLDPHYPVERLQAMLEDALPPVVLTQSSVMQRLPASDSMVIALDALLPRLSGNDAANLRAEAGAEDALLYVIYTSGSTGRPKGIAMPHAAMANLMEWHREVLPCRTEERVLQCAALSFDVAFQETFSTLCTGGTLVLLDEWVRRDPRALLALLRDQRIERLFVPPMLLQGLAECATAEESPNSLKDVITAGEQLRVSAEIVAFMAGLPGARLHNHYGPTETHVVTALTLSGDPRQWPAFPAIGRPIANTRIHLLDARGRPVPIGVVGELFIAGANVARGYLNQPEGAAERFQHDPFSADPQARRYRTGDLGRWRDDGTIEYVGRNDEQVKIRGYRIELGEVEAVLARHPQVREAAVVVCEEASVGKRLVAYVSARDASATTQLSAEVLRAHVAGALPEHMMPSAFVVLERLPLTPSGKLNRRALPAPDFSATLAGQYEPPQGATELALAEVWRELLHVERVGRHDNFFELGGHSLLAVKALYRANHALHVSLAVSEVYKNPTIAALAARIAAGTPIETTVDLTREAMLDDTLAVLSGSPRTPAAAVLVTGATGFVGRFLLVQLLRDTQARLYCLVRGSSLAEAASRLKSALIRWNLWQETFSSRLVAVPGDLTQPRLGLEPSMYAALSQRVDSIFHCAASMSHLETYAMAKAANVESMATLLHLATLGRPKLLNYVSTLGVFSTARPVDELTSIDDERHSSANGYVASKWVAEKMLMKASERGIPCNIFRVGLVWGDSSQGRYDPLQRGYRILKSALLSGVGIAKFQYESPPTPVDYVARALVYLSDRHRIGQGIFHVSASTQPVDGVFEACNQFLDEPLKLVTFHQWIGHMKRLHEEGRSLPIVPLVQFAFGMDEASFEAHQGRLRRESPQVNGARTQRELSEGGIVERTLDIEVLRASVQSLLTFDEDVRTGTARRLVHRGRNRRMSR